MPENHPAPDAPTASLLQRELGRLPWVRWLPWVVLAFSLALTYQLHQSAQRDALQKLQVEFNFRVNDTASRIERRMKAYIQVLRGTQGLFDASSHVTRQDFRTYSAALQLEENYPGIQGLSFSLHVPAAEKKKHIADVRKEGFPDYAIWPESSDEMASPILYVEPFSVINQRAFGFNMYSDPLRRVALEQARDTGLATVSRPVTLRVYTTGVERTGFVVFLPIYEHDVPHDTLSERRANIKGWVQAPFIMDDLMSRILGEQAVDVDIEIHDGAVLSSETILYDSDNSNSRARSQSVNALFSSVRHLSIDGHIWTMVTTSLPAFEVKLDTGKSRFVAVAGTSTSVLLAWLTWLLAHGRERALKTARKMNLELINSEQQTRDAHAQLLDAEELWRFALEGSGLGVWNWNVVSDEISFSTRYREILQCFEEGAGSGTQKLTECVHPEDVTRMVAELQAYLDGKTPVYFCEYRVLTKEDRQLKWLLNRGMLVSRTEDGRPLRMIGTIVDLTERKQAEEELRRAKLDAEQAFTELASYNHAIGQHALISVTDLAGRIVQANDRFCEISGYSRAELLGKNHNIVNSGVHPGSFFAELWITIARGDIWRGELCNKAKNGALYWVDSVIVPIKDVHGTITHYISVRLDITERKKTEAELLNAMVAVAVADNANAAKSAFLANMSHEIRTPMNSIIGMAYLALKTELSPKQRDYIAKIQQSSQHLLGIINDILDFSKIEADRLVLESRDFDLATVIRDISIQLEDSAAAKGLELVFDIAPNLSQLLRGDPLRLEQVLLNYVGNAIKFTHQGRIIVRARVLEETATDSLVRFDVQDTGIGISETEMLHLFMAFQQADTSTTRNYGGTGLGLVICKQLATLMGGEVGVESQPGQGSTFWFTARLEHGTGNALHKYEEPSSVDPMLIKGADILLVEDNLFNQQVARELLEEAGAAVTIANNGQEAIDLLMKAHFDCVLMDIQMPVMDGLEATRQIRANPALSSTRVIGLTANAGREDQTRCFEAGMNDFLSKPIEPGRLLSVLATWLAQRSEQSQPVHVASTVAALPRSPVERSNVAVGDASVIDLSVLAKTVGHNPEKISRYAQLFISSMQDTLTEIGTALTHSDMPTLAALGHRAKSSARTVGAMGFADLCQDLEQCKLPGDYETAVGIVAQMRPLLIRISEKIDQETTG